MQFCHTSNGVFRISILGNCLYGWEYATGIQTFRLESNGLSHSLHACWDVMNFVGGWVTDFTTAYVAKQQGVTLSKTFD